MFFQVCLTKWGVGRKRLLQIQCLSFWKETWPDGLFEIGWIEIVDNLHKRPPFSIIYLRIYAIRAFSCCLGLEFIDKMNKVIVSLKMLNSKILNLAIWVQIFFLECVKQSQEFMINNGGIGHFINVLEFILMRYTKFSINLF